MSHPHPNGLSRDDRHNYYWVDRDGLQGPLPSVTRVVGMLDKPGLAPAAARSVARYVVNNFEGVVRHAEAQGLDATITKLAAVPRTEWDAKASLGSRVHSLAEAHLRGKVIHPLADEAPVIEGLYRFIDRYKPHPVALEEMVAYEDEVGLAYAGTFDLIADLEGKRWLLDIKTGSSLHDEIALQLAAYGHASFAGRPGDLTRYTIPEVEAYGVLHLRPELPDGYALIPYQVGRREWLAFMALLDAWEWVKSPKAKRERIA